jgi:hypothetical protein
MRSTTSTACAASKIGEAGESGVMSGNTCVGVSRACSTPTSSRSGSAARVFSRRLANDCRDGRVDSTDLTVRSSPLHRARSATATPAWTTGRGIRSHRCEAKLALRFSPSKIPDSPPFGPWHIGRMSVERSEIIGERVGKQAKDEAEHFIRCPACNGWIDMRDLGQVLEHEGPLPHPESIRLQ